MTVATSSLLWPKDPTDLEAIEAVPLERRGLPLSSYDVLTRAAERWGDRIATIVLPGAERWEQPERQTHAELASSVRRIAGVYHEFGVQRRDAVALLSVNCEALPAAILAAEAVGIAAPINPGLTADHAEQLVLAAGARVIVASGPELDAAAWELAREVARDAGARALLALRPTGACGSAPALAPIDGVVVDYLLDRAAGHDGGQLPCEPPSPSDVASFVHTGGTTGTPKLAARTHRNQVTNAWMIAASGDLTDDETVFAALPLFHTNALILTVLAPLLKGQSVLWAGPLGYRDLPLYGAFWKIVERYRVAAMSAVPTVYAVLGQVPVDADISSLRLPIVGAAPLPSAVADAFKTNTGLGLFEGYGLTEATCVTARNAPGIVRAGTVGQRLAYQEVHAVETDEETGDWTFLPPGSPGTLVVSGPVVFAGYVVPGSDGKAFSAPDTLRGRWLNTGDLGIVDADGFVTLTGRAKDLIIRGGHNIDPVVIEDALLEHPQVTGAAAVGKPDAHAGEVPVAYVTLAPGADVSGEELVAWAAGRVPERAAAPKAVDVIDEIPLTLVGKPFKPALRCRAAGQAAAGALGDGAVVTAELVDGRPLISVQGVDAEACDAALTPLGLRWRVAGGS